ncbi:hypothetical protein Gasu2_28650 [Galdieria sulphuraria]|uniref:Calmodulin n=1 Tax=Galdieria sulphuraria TaxID=130081 RepID=M2XY76_GALSU|nr:calmodulin [Galdieria sulphuraria]EME28608.1 calmodulin [Galdieria sulphuraria]GJD08570.1 hypothetical protein Gasu2_28650 [Galdieria sulphuraria]|eukprot:XP_005705128.1 calmodulin [Galdieria sulphuraria]
MTRDGERLLTHNKIQYMQNAFSLLDRNKDGKIDLKDLDIISNVFKDISRDKVEEALRIADLDEDENLDIFEFQALIAKTYETESQRKLEVASLCSFLQGAKDNEISIATLASIICQMDSEMTKAKAEEMLQSVFPGKQTVKMEEIYELFP